MAAIDPEPPGLAKDGFVRPEQGISRYIEENRVHTCLILVDEQKESVPRPPYDKRYEEDGKKSKDFYLHLKQVMQQCVARNLNGIKMPTIIIDSQAPRIYEGQTRAEEDEQRTGELTETWQERFPGAKHKWHKNLSLSETNALVIPALRDFLEGYDAVVIAGFHVNSCCAATARAAAAMGKMVITSPAIVRGNPAGKDEPKPGNYTPEGVDLELASSPGAMLRGEHGWPIGTIVCQQI